MREIRQKPESREQRILHRTGRIPKSVIRDMAARSKEKSVEEIKTAPFASEQEESSNTPVNDAGEQMVSTAKDTAKKGADLAYRGGKKLTQAVREKTVYRIKQRTKAVRENTGKITNIRENPLLEGSPISVRNASDKSLPSVASRKTPSRTLLKCSQEGFSQRNQMEKHSNIRSISDVSDRPSDLKIQERSAGSMPESRSTAKITDSGRTLSPRQNTSKDLAPKSIRTKNLESPIPRLNSGSVESANSTLHRPDAKRQIRSIREKPKKGIKTVRRTIREPVKKIRTAQKTAQKARQAQKTAVQAAKRTQQATRMSIKAAKLTVRAVVTAVKTTISAVRTLITAIVAGGWVAVIVILAVCVIGLLVGSVYGIFAGDTSNTGQGIPVRQAVETLDAEFQDSIENISDTVSHDRRKITSSDGPISVQWEDVLSVFSAWVAGDEAGTPVTTLTDAQLDDLRILMWEMIEIDYDTHVETHTEKVTEIDEKGNKKTHTETVRETVLTIEITHKSPSEVEKEYSFTDRQKEYLALLTSPDTDPLWAQLLGPYSTGAGEIISPDTGWKGTGVFQWPLPESFTITSYFGNREDPFTGQPSYHDGTDIAAPAGTPILAAADGTVETANGTDSWGGGYGYYIKIRHDDSSETLYAHCSAVCVSAGQKVEQGEVIGYVGTTGNSTGNHLHFEIWVNGQKTDALNYFANTGE